MFFLNLTLIYFSRDWRGLAHLSGISGEMIPGFFSSADPTSGVLAQWSQKGVHIANLRRLQEYLGKMDRFDVYDDTRHLFGKFMSFI